MCTHLIVLRRKSRCTFFQHIHGLNTEFGTYFCKLVKQTSACLIFRYTHLALCDHIAGVESHIHAHRCHARDCIPVDDGPLDRCRTTVFRKQRRMHVYASVTRHIKNTLRQDLSESSHDNDIRIIFFQIFHVGIIPDTLRLKYLDIMCKRTLLDRRKLHRIASSLRFIRLGDNKHNLVSRTDDLFQCSHRKIRCSHKYYSHIIRPHLLLHT